MKNVPNYLLTKIIIQMKGHSSHVLEKLIFYFYNLKINRMERYDLA